MVKKSILREIDQKREKIVKNPKYWLARDARVRRSIHASAKVYQWMIDHPDFVGNHKSIIGTGEKSKRIQFLRENIDNFKSAWSYLFTY